MIESFSALNEFHFIRAHWLWAIIPLLIIVVMIRYVNKQKLGWALVLALSILHIRSCPRSSLT